MKYLKTSKWTVWDSQELGLFHRNRYYPVCVFVLESLFGTYLSNKNNLKIYNI
jgi:hypothetical protein